MMKKSTDKPKKKKSLRERLAERREDLKRNTGHYNTFIFPKPGEYRMRPVNVGKEEDFAIELLYVFLNKELGGFISPATFGKACFANETYIELSKSKDDADRDLAKKLKPKIKWGILHYRYKDIAGKEVDVDSGIKPTLLTKDLYGSILDYYMDPETGDFTDPYEGYDLLYKREGTGQFDTEYSVRARKVTKCHKDFRGPYNLREEIEKIIPSYEETETLIKKFLKLDDEEESPKKKSGSGLKKKKKVKRDI